jgi:hypothetical protein
VIHVKQLATSAVVAAALTLAILVPAAAAPPVFSGTLTCLDAVDGEVRELNPVDAITRRDIATWRTFWNKSGFCANGSFDTTGLIQV